MNLSGYIIAFPSPVGTGTLVTMWFPTEASARETLAKYQWKDAVVRECNDAYQRLTTIQVTNPVVVL